MDIRSDHVNVISLCTGGGGLDLGIELAMPSSRVVVMVEREAFAVAHLVAAMQQGLLAQAPLWDDVATFNGRPWRGLVDGVIGGIPCQPHSQAGQRLGEDDERDLWSDARRIIIQSGAWFVIIENVEGMLSSGGAARVVGDLQRLGFEVEVGLFSAAEAGASQERNRVFIFAVANADSSRHQGNELGQTSGAIIGKPASRSAAELRRSPLERTAGERRREGKPKPEFRHGRDSVAGASRQVASTDSVRQQARQDGAIGRAATRDDLDSGDEMEGPARGAGAPDVGGTSGYVLPLFAPGPDDREQWRAVLDACPALEPSVCRVADGLAFRLDRIRLLGNGVVPLQAAYAVRTLAARLAARGSMGANELVLKGV